MNKIKNDKRMKKIIAIILALFITTAINTQAQEIISTNGSYNEFSGGSISWTMGEPIIETQSNGSNDLTQGFQQADLNVITSIASISACQGDVIIPINIQNISNVANFSISLGYNSSQMAYNHYQNVNPALSAGTLSVVPGPTEITISWSSVTPVSIGDAALLEISFSAIASSTLSWNVNGGNSQYKDLSAGVFPAEFNDATVTIQPLATADAGADVSICVGETYMVVDATAVNSNSILWTGGLGAINDETSLMPTYIPAPGETGAVLLTLTAQAIEPCTVAAVSYKTIFIQNSPTAYAGMDASLLPSETYTLSNAMATNENSLLWETSGDGNFDSELTLNATYFPGENDKLAGYVELTLTAQAISPCAVNAVDLMGLIIYRPPTVEILSPSDGDSFFDFPIVVDGSAGDLDGDLLEVYVSLNNNSWELTAGTSIWSKALIMEIGNNSIRAKSVDAQGLESEIAEINVTAGIQLIPIAQGWSAISSFLAPLDPAMELVMADVGIPGNLTIMLGSLGLYWPEFNSNSIGDWNTLEGYKTKFEHDDLLTFSGTQLVDNVVTFGTGFHIIPVLSSVPASIANIFSDPVNDVKYLFDLTSGEIYWPQGGIMDLTELTPGRGYLANFNKEVTINFPAHQNLKSGVYNYPPVPQQTSPWDIERTGSVHLISIDHKAALELKVVSHIGAFDAYGQCIGSVAINDVTGNYLLTVFGDDATTDAKDGAVDGEFLTFKAFNPQQNMAYEINPVFSNQMPDVFGKFKTNGMSMITGFKESSTGIGGSTVNTLQVELFPNPAREQVTVICPAYSEYAQIEAEFVNAVGKVAMKVQLSSQSTRLDLNDMDPGVYFVKITSETGTVIKKLVIQ
jgi:hypothetical protein